MALNIKVTLNITNVIEKPGIRTTVDSDVLKYFGFKTAAELMNEMDKWSKKSSRSKINKKEKEILQKHNTNKQTKLLKIKENKYNKIFNIKEPNKGNDDHLNKTSLLILPIKDFDIVNKSSLNYIDDLLTHDNLLRGKRIKNELKETTSEYVSNYNPDNESYAHKCAKRILIKWLENNCTLMNMDKQEQKNLSFYEEYPIIDQSNYNSWSRSLIELLNSKKRDKYEYVSVKECNDNGLFQCAVIDIVCLNNNRPCGGFEIVNTHECDNIKISKLKKAKCQDIYEISADWILKQTKPPNYLKILKKLC